jgi:hypothetical protein|tara:strand:+ start:5429 stop:5677 length:249 start_codon:yes stop_codon:yes gene_type:complete
MIVGIGFLLSFLVEHDSIKLFHAVVWGLSYFGGVVALVLIVIDIVVSIAITRVPHKQLRPEETDKVQVVELPEAIATKSEVI